MSVSIYNGFTVHLDMRNFREFTTGFRKIVQREGGKNLDEVIQAHGWETVFGRDAAWVEHTKNLTECSVAIFPSIEGTSYSGIVGILYTSQKEWVRKFMRLRGVSDYSYWDNSDWPKGMKKEQWENRRNDWEIVLPEGKGFSPTPAQNMFTMDFHDSPMMTYVNWKSRERK